jgi:hypothetical protein
MEYTPEVSIDLSDLSNFVKIPPRIKPKSRSKCDKLIDDLLVLISKNNEIIEGLINEMSKQNKNI